MSRKKLEKNELKIKLSIRMNPKLYVLIDKLETNKSKYFEWLVYRDLLKREIINKENEIRL